jgi:hypothetical protein
MNWQQVVTHDDAYASLVRAHHRREIVAARKRRRRIARLTFAPFGLAGAAMLAWAIVTFDPPTMQAAKVVLGTALVLPWLATFDVLGQVPR